FDLHVFAGAQALDALACVHLRGSGEDGGLDAGMFEAFAEIGGPMRNAELLCHLAGRVRAAAGECRDLDTGDLLDGLDVFDAERALSGDTDLHFLTPLVRGTAVRRPCSKSARDRNDTPRAHCRRARRASPATSPFRCLRIPTRACTRCA